MQNIPRLLAAGVAAILAVVLLAQLATEAQAPIGNQPSSGSALFAGPVRFAVSPPVRTLPPEQAPISDPAALKGEPPSTPRRLRNISNLDLPRVSAAAASALRLDNPLGADSAIQRSAGRGLAPRPIRTFDGISNEDNFNAFGFRVVPPDTDGDVGPEHYVQIVNLLVKVFSKRGKSLTGPFKMSSLFASLGAGSACAAIDDGDPIVLYDPLADRWLLSQFALPFFPFPPYFQCIAISQTGDPTGAYFLYEYLMPNDKLNDYPKFGV
jgi:hypothetical protein